MDRPPAESAPPDHKGRRSTKEQGRAGPWRFIPEKIGGEESNQSLGNSGGFGIFAVQVRATGELAGMTGLAVPRFLPEVMPAVEIAWRLGRPFWNQGIATEAARAALDFGLTGRGLDRIGLSCHWRGSSTNGVGVRPCAQSTRAKSKASMITL